MRHPRGWENGHNKPLQRPPPQPPLPLPQHPSAWRQPQPGQSDRIRQRGSPGSSTDANRQPGLRLEPLLPTRASFEMLCVTRQHHSVSIKVVTRNPHVPLNYHNVTEDDDLGLTRMSVLLAKLALSNPYSPSRPPPPSVPLLCPRQWPLMELACSFSRRRPGLTEVLRAEQYRSDVTDVCCAECQSH